MRIDIRPVAKLRGPNPVNVAAVIGPVVDALGSSSLDLARLRVVCDWIQYRQSFTEPVGARPVLAERALRAGGTAGRRPRARWRSPSTCAGAEPDPGTGRRSRLSITVK